MIINQNIPIVIFAVGVFGLIFGSFITALVHRVHSGSDFVKDRSRCPKCKHILSFLDLFPVFSWLFLGGKCRYCQTPISKLYPLTELITSLLFIISWLALQPDTLPEYLKFGLWLAQIVMLVALSVYDIKWMILPTSFIYVLAFFATSSVFLEFVTQGDVQKLVSSLVGALLYFGVFYSLYQFSKGQWIGGGDVRLVAVLGLVGWYLSLLSLFIASLAGTIFGLPQLITKKKSKMDKIPFGPFLIMGFIVTSLYGERILNWYLGILQI
jgi:leader peptidase (prepilin peptidase)/N-methyltransferase